MQPLIFVASTFLLVLLLTSWPHFDLFLTTLNAWQVMSILLFDNPVRDRKFEFFF